MLETYPETHRMTFSEMKESIKIRFICSYLWVVTVQIFCAGRVLLWVPPVCK